VIEESGSSFWSDIHKREHQDSEIRDTEVAGGTVPHQFSQLNKPTSERKRWWPKGPPEKVVSREPLISVNPRYLACEVERALRRSGSNSEGKDPLYLYSSGGSGESRVHFLVSIQEGIARHGRWATRFLRGGPGLATRLKKSSFGPSLGANCQRVAGRGIAKISHQIRQSHFDKSPGPGETKDSLNLLLAEGSSKPSRLRFLPGMLGVAGAINF